MELRDECNNVNCAEFQLYIEIVVRDIQLFCDFTTLCVPVVTSQVTTGQFNLHKSTS